MSPWEPPYVDVSVEKGAVDLPPSTGTDVDPHPGIDLTEAEIEVGNQLGEAIDPDDDLDNGGVPVEEPPPGESVLAPVDLPGEPTDPAQVPDEEEGETP